MDEKAYKLLSLPSIEFEYGDIDFFNEKTIDKGQEGFRYNGLTGEKIDEWVGDEYIIIGYDCTAGCGPDPYIVKSDDPNLPVYWLMTDGGDWSNPELICDVLDNNLMDYIGYWQEKYYRNGFCDGIELIVEYLDK